MKNDALRRLMAGRKDLFHPDLHQVEILNDSELTAIVGGKAMQCGIYSCGANNSCSQLTCSTYCSHNTPS